MSGVFAAEQLQHYGYSTGLNVFQKQRDPIPLILHNIV